MSTGLDSSENSLQDPVASVMDFLDCAYLIPWFIVLSSSSTAPSASKSFPHRHVSESSFSVSPFYPGNLGQISLHNLHAVSLDFVCSLNCFLIKPNTVVGSMHHDENTSDCPSCGLHRLQNRMERWRNGGM